MKKYLVATLMLFVLIALVACDNNSEIPEPTATQNENNQTEGVGAETPAENLPTEELKIQIDAATDELLSTFANLHRADVRVPGQSEGVNLVIWANQPLPSFGVTMLLHDSLEDSDEWGFNPADSFGSVEMLLPGEAFVIENYAGAGTLPNRGITFSDENGANIRVFFFQENHAYPEHGGRWIIREIEEDRIIWQSVWGVTIISWLTTRSSESQAIINKNNEKPLKHFVFPDIFEAQAAYQNAGGQYRDEKKRLSYKR